MASRWAPVMRGGRNPFVVLVTSRAARASGEAVPNPPEPVVTTFCDPKFGDTLVPAMAASFLMSALTMLVMVGTATGQKLAFYNATPIVQPAAAAQAAAAAQTQDAVTDSSGGTASTTLAAITAGAAYDQNDMVAIKDAIASIAAQLAKIKTDVANIKTLQDAERTALVNLGLMKGAA